MRLLKIDGSGNLSLEKFDGNVPPYAILSHTWGKDEDEVKFDDIGKNTYAPKVGYKKIRFCGEQAKRSKLEYFWVDTSCIDKSSSAELSEAINSMFRWYKESAQCYVYLADVTAAEYSDGGALRNSKWFTRGWTLQELLASPVVHFFSNDEKFLGDKKSLARQIHGITDIPESLLCSTTHMSHYNVEERLQWAEKRQTTRKEDKAYCLLGMFDVSMPALYGEGEDKAFERLSNEIKRRHPGKHLLLYPVQRAADADRNE
jgi:hypothetical protein